MKERLRFQPKATLAANCFFQIRAQTAQPRCYIIQFFNIEMAIQEKDIFRKIKRRQCLWGCST
jgi:hypothetical protein